MKKFDIIDLYKEGYTINNIIDKFYNFKNSAYDRIQKVGNDYLIKKNPYTKEKCREIVYKTIYEYIQKGE